MLKIKNVINYFSEMISQPSLIVQIGQFGILVSAFHNKKIIDHIFFTSVDFNKTDKFIEFIEKFPKAKIYLLIDNNETIVSHASIPIMNSIFSHQVINKYIAKEFGEDNLVANLKLSETKSPIERWDMLFVSSPILEPTQKIIDILVSKNYNYQTLHLLPMEAGSVIQGILNKFAPKLALKDDLINIFVAITKCSHLKIIASYNNNVLDNKSIELPSDKSDAYTQGMIEHEISETLLKLKGLISKEELQTNAIVLGGNEVIKLLRESDIKTNYKTLIPISELQITAERHKNDKQLNLYADFIIANIFSKIQFIPALHSKLGQFTKLQKFKTISIRVVASVIIILAMFTLSLRYEISDLSDKTSELNQKFFQAAKELRAIRDTYPKISNLNQISDILSLQQIVQKPVPKAIDTITKLNSIKEDGVVINKISWELMPQNSLTKAERNILLLVTISYAKNTSTTKDAFDNIDRYIKAIQKEFKDYEVVNTRMPSTGGGALNVKLKIFGKLEDTHG